jgi:hypothetical protein
MRGQGTLRGEMVAGFRRNCAKRREIPRRLETSLCPFLRLGRRDDNPDRIVGEMRKQIPRRLENGLCRDDNPSRIVRRSRGSIGGRGSEGENSRARARGPVANLHWTRPQVLPRRAHFGGTLEAAFALTHFLRHESTLTCGGKSQGLRRLWTVVQG